ncbi:MAG: hypothetical protein JO317_01780 [Verrucomicrobiae bacterium]|nr:hypothetical protein [Verrucomicrobiae bacterium]
MKFKNPHADSLAPWLLASVLLHLLFLSVFIGLGVWSMLTRAWESSPRTRQPPVDPQRMMVLLQVAPQPQRFIETDAAQESKTPPKSASFYSDRNAQAQDQSERNDRNRADIRGKNPNIDATEDVSAPRPTVAPSPPSQPAEPAKPPAPEKPPPSPAEKPSKPVETSPGDLAMLQKSPPVPAAPAQPHELEPAPERPPSQAAPDSAQARAPPSRPQNKSIPTEAAQVSGGINRKGVVSLDTLGTPSGHYDRIMYQAISQRWQLLVGDRYRNQGGNVAVEFDLLSSGEVRNVQVRPDTSVGIVLAELCREAINDSAPFRQFPPALQPIWGDSRHVKILFQYAF